MILWILKNTVLKLIGKLSPEEKQEFKEFVSALVEAGAKGVAEGTVDGFKNR